MFERASVDQSSVSGGIWPTLLGPSDFTPTTRTVIPHPISSCCTPWSTAAARRRRGALVRITGSRKEILQHGPRVGAC
ncbi:unnamed protein product [Durusdinium trenchii]|uniref:Uncharacterized protein n=1 Tax=Durusdinium trenchii TaxID=1381693 RepID=A0ABP0PYQ3_9DINO